MTPVLAKRILIFNVNWVGDVVFTTPIFKALKKHYPSSHVACLAVGRVAGLLECVPGVDEVIVYDEKGRHRGLWGKLCLARSLRLKKFDIVFLLHRSWTRAFLVFCAGIPRRVGYDTKNRGWLLTDKIPPDTDHIHRSDHYLHIVESLDIPIADRACELKVDARAASEVLHLLQTRGVHEADHLSVLHVGGNWDLKRWPRENWQQLVAYLTREGKTKIVLPGTRKDEKLIAEIAADIEPAPVILTGMTNLKQLMALLQRANVVISADSGPLHIANSLGTDVIALFGPTRPEVTGPRGRGRTVVLQEQFPCNQQPCYHLSCANNRCMQAISVQAVMNAVHEVRVPSLSQRRL